MSEEGRNGQPPCIPSTADPPPDPIASPVEEQRCAGEDSDGGGGCARLCQWLKILMTSIGSLPYGCMSAFTSVLAADLSLNDTTIYGSRITLTGRQLDLFSSLFLLGNIFGSLGIAPVMATSGRRPSLALAALVALIGWLGVILIPVYPGIIAARIIGGMGCGALNVVVATLLLELAPSDKRGLACSMTPFGILAGQLVMTTLGYGERYYVAAGFAALIPAAVLLMIPLLPESPAFLALKGKTEAAKKVLKNPREPSADLESEISKHVNSAVDVPAMRKWRSLLEPDILKPFFIVSTLFIFVYFSGGLVMVANSSRILKMMCSPLPDGLSSILIMVIQLAGAGFELFLVDKIGRKPTLLLATLLATAGLSGLTVYVASTNPTAAMSSFNQTMYREGNISNLALYDASLTTGPADVYPGEAVVMLVEHQCDSGSWLPLVGLMVTQGGFGLGAFAIPMLLANENFPAWIRPQTCSICFCVGIVCSIGALQMFTPILEALGLSYVLGIHACVALTYFVFTLIFVKETKYKHLD